MSQKELNYVEDIYNHECLIINIISTTLESCEDDKYCALLNEHLKKHEGMSKKLLKLLEGLS